jgi:uncharacterized membrane protein (DUF441 family)
MANIGLTIGYFAVVGIVVASRDSFLDNNLVVLAVTAVVLFAGLGLWLLIAQGHKE